MYLFRTVKSLTSIIAIIIMSLYSLQVNAQTGCCQIQGPTACTSPVTATQCETIANSVSFHAGGTCRISSGVCGVLQGVINDQGDGVNNAIPETQLVALQGNPNINNGLDAGEAVALIDQVLQSNGIDPTNEPGLPEAIQALQQAITNPLDENGNPQPDPQNQVSMAELVDIELVELQLQSVEPINPSQPLPVLSIPTAEGPQPLAFDFRQTFQDELAEPGIPTFVFTDMFQVDMLTDDPNLPPGFVSDNQVAVKIWTWMFVLKKITETITETVQRVVVIHGDKSVVVEEEVETTVVRWVFVQVHSHPMIDLDDPVPGPSGIPTTGFTSELAITARASEKVPMLPLAGLLAFAFVIIGIAINTAKRRAA